MVQNRNIRNILLVGLFCFFLATIVWYWTELKIQFYLSGSKNQIEKIGQIKDVNYDALLNFSGQLIWQKINEGDFIFVGNSLQTDQDSSTEIILDDGQQITIGKNSLVRFIKEDDSISLQLVEGKIEVKNDKKISELVSSSDTKKAYEFFLSTPQGRINTKAVSLKIEKKSKNSNDLKYEIISGQPKILDSTNKIKEIVSSKVDLEIKKEEKIVELPKIEPTPMKPDGPAPVVVAPALPTTPAKVVPEIKKMADIPLPQKQVRTPAQVPKKKSLKLPQKIPLSAPKIKRVDVKVVE